jgi:hypothetical protein
MNAFGATLRAGLRGKLDCFADAHIGPAAADVAAHVIGSAADLTDIEAETVFDIAGPILSSVISYKPVRVCLAPML